MSEKKYINYQINKLKKKRRFGTYKALAISGALLSLPLISYSINPDFGKIMCCGAIGLPLVMLKYLTDDDRYSEQISELERRLEE